MASPTPSGFTGTSFTTADTSFVVNIPAAAVAGERVFIAFGYGVTGNTISFPAGTGLVVEKQVEANIGGTNGLYCMVYEVQGAETTITLAATVSTKGAAVSCLVQGDEDPGTQAPEFSTGASGSNAPPNPDAVTPTGGSKDYLFIIAGSMGGETAMTGADADYSNFTEADSGTAGATTSNSRTAIATRQLTAAASDDPDPFTGGDATQEWAAMTIAFHPAGTGSQSVTPGLISQVAATFTPTITPGSVSVAPALISQVAAIFAPTIAQVTNIAPGLISQPASTFTPTVTPGSVSVTPALISQLAAVFAPTVTPIQSVTLGLISQLAEAFAPTVAPGTVNVSPPLIGTAASVFAPDIEVGDAPSTGGGLATIIRRARRR